VQRARGHAGQQTRRLRGRAALAGRRHPRAARRGRDLAVDEARRDFDEFRDSIELQRELGISGFAQGLKIRKQALELARGELAKIRRPAGSSTSKQRMTLEEYQRLYERERYPQYIDKVWLKPAGRVGSRVPPVEERVQVVFVGSDTPYTPKPTTADAETLKTLRAAHGF